MRADTQERMRLIRRALPRWYRRHGRDLPWRRTSDPYAVWVAEVMLQQTQVATVRPYFERFMRRFPDVGSLARARPDAVLKAWEGLGYYGRARNLHRAAGQVAGELGGRLPRTARELRRLAGIGPYTAGAIASIAFGADEPVLDGNVARVLCRVFAVGGDAKSSRVRRRLWSLAEALLPAGRAGAFNQALMDLGATVCVPRGPGCARCPLARACRARERGRQDRFPGRSPRRAIPHETAVVGLIRRRGRLLIDRRRDEGLLGGLWEFPGGKVRRGESLAAALRREVAEEVGLRVRAGRKLTVVRHAYSHFTVTLHAFECAGAAGRARAIACAAVRWVRPSELGRYAFPAATRRIIAALADGR